jgi:hypothetical protein
MSTERSYLGTVTLPVGVFGGDPDELEFEIEVAFANLPLAPTSETRTVRVE